MMMEIGQQVRMWEDEDGSYVYGTVTDVRTPQPGSRMSDDVLTIAWDDGKVTRAFAYYVQFAREWETAAS